MLNALHSPFKKGVFYDPDLFSMGCYQNKWGSLMMNSAGKTEPFREFAEGRSQTREKWFIRPDGDAKNFAGGVKSTSEIHEWYPRIKDLEIPELGQETLVIADVPREIRREWRNFVVDGEVIASTRYQFEGKPEISGSDTPKEMLEFAQQAARRYEPHPVFVLDVAEVAGEYKVIEANCFNGTGFYDPKDAAKVIPAVQAWALRNE